MGGESGAVGEPASVVKTVHASRKNRFQSDISGNLNCTHKGWTWWAGLCLVVGTMEKKCFFIVVEESRGPSTFFSLLCIHVCSLP